MTPPISLKAYRTIKECDKLFSGYKVRISNLDNIELWAELERYKTEAINYPHHLLTVVKGKILMDRLKRCNLNDDMKQFHTQEEARLAAEVYNRLSGEWNEPWFR